MRDRAKWDAWKAVEGKTSEQIDFYRFMSIFLYSSIILNFFKTFVAGKSKEEAMGDYVTKVKQLLEEAGASTWCFPVVFLPDSK